MISFNADEILEMAKQIEHNGGRFYRAAAKPADGEAKTILLKLAEMEDQHEKVFAAMQAELAATETTPMTFDPDDETVQYLQAMVDGKVFSGDPCALLSGDESIRDVLDIAISIEKDSIIFYQCMKPNVPPELGRSKLDAIIGEEIGHILILTKHQQALCDS